MNSKKILILSTREINRILFKSQRYQLRRLIYFDAIFEYFISFDKKEISNISTIIVDQSMFRGSDFFKTMKLLKNQAKKISIVVLLKQNNYVLKEKLIKLGVEKIFIEEKPNSLPMTDIVGECMDDPFILNYLEKRREALLKEVVFSINEINKQSSFKKFYYNFRKKLFEIFHANGKDEFNNIKSIFSFFTKRTYENRKKIIKEKVN